MVNDLRTSACCCLCFCFSQSLESRLPITHEISLDHGAKTVSLAFDGGIMVKVSFPLDNCIEES